MRTSRFASPMVAGALRPILLALALSFAFSACAAPEVTKEIVEGVLKSSWDKEATSTNAKSTLTLNELRLGPATRATVQEVQVEGIPDNAMVTPAVVDFTVRTYYTNETQAVRRVREARVYKDKMGDWAVMTGSVKGQDTTTKE